MVAAAASSFRIGFDVSALDESFKAHAARGIGRYVRELKKYFDGSGASMQGVAVGEFDHRDLTTGSAADRLIDTLPFGRHTVRQQIMYPLRLSKLARGRFDAVHFPAHMDAPSWSVGRYALTVLDLIPLVCADLYRAARPGWRFHLARRLEMRAIRSAAVVLAISENTARDVEHILGVPRDRIVVTPLGVDRRFFGARDTAPAELDALRARLDLPAERPIVLYVGGIDQRKNTAVLLEAFAEARRRLAGSGTAPLLVMVGNIAGDEHFPELKRRIEELELGADVRIAGYLPDRDLLCMYALSALFFFPSLYEGFGLPPLEAMAAGLPVVSSGTSAMPEVIGDAGLMFDPTDARAAADALCALLADSDRRGELRALGAARAELFTWERTGRATLEAYRLLSNQGRA